MLLAIGLLEVWKQWARLWNLSICLSQWHEMEHSPLELPCGETLRSLCPRWWTKSYCTCLIPIKALLNEHFAHKSLCNKGKLDLRRKSGLIVNAGCPWFFSQTLSLALVPYVGVSTLPKYKQRRKKKPVNGQHPGAHSELLLCFQSSDTSMAMKQLK